MVKTISAAHPRWGAYESRINGGNTELADAVRFKVPAITIFGARPNGEASYWHQVHDTFDNRNIYYDAAQAVSLVRALL